jgi:hypothetical protein
LKNHTELFGGGHGFCENFLDLHTPFSAGFLVTLNEEYGGRHGTEYRLNLWYVRLKLSAKWKAAKHRQV